MRRRAATAALALLLAAASPGAGRAQGAGMDPAELAFWQSAQASGDPREYQAYLDAYPNGLFASLARLRLASGRPQPAAAQPPVGPRQAPPAAPATLAAQAWIRPDRPSVPLVQGVTVELDAQALRTSSNLRVAVVPADAPDAVTDAQAFAEDATPVTPSRLRLTVPAGPPGRDEVRLYHVPRFADAYAVAARAPVVVEPGVKGATLARDLVREAARLGPVRFEANHRDRPVLVQAAFLRVRPETDWNLQWFGRGAWQMPTQVAVISIGLPNVAPNGDGSRGEVLCVVSTQDRAALDYVAGLRVGDPVLARGVPTSWSNAGPADPVLLNGCDVIPR